MKVRIPEFVLGLGVGVAALTIVLISTSDVASHYEVCETTKEGAKECATYGVIHFAVREVGRLLDAYSAFITAVATIFIAWFTFSLRQSTDKLWDAGERQLEFLRTSSESQSREMQNSIQAANRSADAAIASNDITTSTAERQLRAYILAEAGIVTNVIAGEISGDGIPVGTVTLKNFGLTPGYDVRSVNGFALNNFPIPESELLISDAEFKKGISVAPLAPGQVHVSRIIYAKGRLQDSTVAALQNGTAVIYLYGEVRYRDAFGHERRSKYRLMMGGPFGVTPGGRLIACDKGNEAD